jgi:hypothetical protein
MKKYEVTIELEIDEEHPEIESDGDVPSTLLGLIEAYLEEDDYINIYEITVKEDTN